MPEEAIEFQQSFLTLPNGLYRTASLLIKNVRMHVPALGSEDASRNALTEASPFQARARACEGLSTTLGRRRSQSSWQNPSLFSLVSKVKFFIYNSSFFSLYFGKSFRKGQHTSAGAIVTMVAFFWMTTEFDGMTKCKLLV